MNKQNTDSTPATPGGEADSPTPKIIRIADPAQQAQMRQMAIDLARMAADSRCSEVVVLDISGASPVTDYYVIATGTSDRQMKAVAEEMAFTYKRAGNPAMNIAGTDAPDPDWILLDFVDIVVHLFTEESRHYYDLEMLWGDAKQVAWQRENEPTETDSE